MMTFKMADLLVMILFAPLSPFFLWLVALAAGFPPGVSEGRPRAMGQASSSIKETFHGWICGSGIDVSTDSFGWFLKGLILQTDTKVHFFKSLLKIEVKDYFETKMKLEEG